jgi:hypothetical protein
MPSGSFGTCPQDRSGPRTVATYITPSDENLLTPRKARFVRKAITPTLIGLLIALCGCASYDLNSGPIEPPAEGFQAIRFRRPVIVRDHAINILTFTTGSTFVADRQFQYGTVYCGHALVNNILGTLPECVALEGDTTLVLRPDSIYIVRREIPAGSVERFRMK